jgi:peptidoglycan/xylan/chitin deacetylase (PgdA/CDA1 family)
MKNICIFTNDVETTSIWFNTLREETVKRVIMQGMPALLDIYKKNGIKSTFFFTADSAAKYPEMVRMILPFWHEVGSHGYTHEIEKAFDVLDYKTQLKYLLISKRILEDISGQEVVSFRAPALRVNKYTPLALAEAGYRIDSSIASQRFDFFLSFGSLKKLTWLFAPRAPYMTMPGNLAKRGNGPIVEVPLSAIFFPYVGTTMRMLPSFSHLLRFVIELESRITGKPIVFDIHPNELVDESELKRKIQRRSQNIIRYLLTDLIRSKLKGKNLGPKAIPLYKNEVMFYMKKGYKFVTLKEYCKISGLIN